jgi:hypothetical protein
MIAWATAVRDAAGVIALGAVLAPMTAVAAAKNDPPKLSAQQILTKNAAARGGLEAWRKVDGMLWTGHIESARATVPLLQFLLAQQSRGRKYPRPHGHREGGA